MRSPLIALAALVVSFFAVPVAAAGPDPAVSGGPLTASVRLASTSANGTKGDDRSEAPDLSADGRLVAFSSLSTTLDPADTNSFWDIFAKDVPSGELFLVSATDDGVVGNQLSLDPSISADGTTVTFTSSASNLDPSDIDAFSDVFVKNLASGDLTLVSTSEAGVKQNGGSVDPDLSRDANLVIFTSTATNLDPADVDTTLDIYAKNVSTGDISLASSSDSGVKGNNHSSDGIVAPSGLRVAFSSQATNLDSADSDAVIDVYVKTLATEELDLVSASDSGVKGNATSGFPALSASGLRVAFQSNATNLDPADTDPYDSSPAGVEVSLITGVGVGGDAGGDTVIGVEGIGGTPFPDDLSGDGGANELGGGPGDDVLTGGGGADILTGGPGLDTASYAASPAAVAVDIGAGTAIGGAATGDDLTSVEGVVGSAFADTLTGDAADNVFLGMGGGDDLDAGLGFDFVYYQFSTSGVTVDLTAQTASGGHATGDTLAGFESVLGSSFADVLSGNDDANHLLGQGGDDTLAGFDGDDLLLGTTGIDTFSAGDGTDTCDFVAGEVHLSCEL